MSTAENIRSWSRKQGCPATIVLLASLIGAALVFWLTQMRGSEWFVLGPDSHLRPWTFLTYAWTAMPLTDPFNIILFAFLVMWMFWIGGSLERQMGSRPFVVLWFSLVLLSGAVIWASTNMLSLNFMLAGPYLPEVAMATVWCARNQTSMIRLWCAPPLSGKWFAVVLAAITFLTYGSRNPLLGILALIPLGVGWLYGAGRLPQIGGRQKAKSNPTRGQVVYDDAYFDDVKRREREREEKEKLRKLLEGSIEE